MLKHIYEHLKTRKKYNTLLIKYEAKKDELEQKIIELNTQKNINKIEREKFAQALEQFINKDIQNKTKKIKNKNKKKENKNENNKCKCK